MTPILMIPLAFSATHRADEPHDTTGFEAFREVFFPGAVGALSSPRARRYIARFDSEVAEVVKAFDFDKGLLDLSGPLPPPEIAGLEANARKPYAESGKYEWLYSLGRGSASAIGAFALAWALPGSEYHGDAQLRQGVIRGLEAFRERQAPSGEFVFCSIRFSSVYETHEMAWRLEPLLGAYLCIRHTLPPAQAKRFHDGLERASDYLHTALCDSQSNRGCVWCGVMALAAKMFDRPTYLDRVRENWAWVGRRVFDESGQVIEGPGPDFIYAYESFSYTFGQRLATGNRELDAPLMRSLDWFCTMQDSDGLPMQAVSTRLANYGPKRLSFLAAALEYYARQRPYYATLAATYLDILERETGTIATEHGGIMWMGAALYHDPTVKREPLPDRLRRFTSSYSFDVTHYLNVRRDYHTLVLFSGVRDLAGLQHWCLNGERPVLFEYPGGESGVRAWGIDTARIKLRRGWRTDSSDLVSASVDWDGIRTCYIFGESSTWVINVAPGLCRQVRWAVHRRRCAMPVVSGRTIRSKGQKSRIDMGPQAPTLTKTDGGWLVQASLPETEPVDWAVFHDGRPGPVLFELKERLLIGRLQENGRRHHVYFNARDDAVRIDNVELAPLQVRVRRMK